MDETTGYPIITERPFRSANERTRRDRMKISNRLIVVGALLALVLTAGIA